MRRLLISAAVLSVVGPTLCAAQSLPTLTAGGAGYVLTVPYLEYVTSGTSKLAYTASLTTSDLSNWTLTSAAGPQSPLTAASEAPVVAQLNNSFRFSIPRLSYAAGGTTKYYSIVLTTTDLSRFTLDLTTAREIGAPSSLAAPSRVAVTNVDARTVGSQRIYSSSKLSVAWTPPIGYTVDHYEIAASESVYGSTVTTTASATETIKTVTDLKAATAYSVTVKACRDSGCAASGVSTPESGTTSSEYWQLQGSGNTVNGLSKIVSDGNARISGTRFGPDAGGPNLSRLQLYYGPAAGGAQALAVAVTSLATDATVPASYLSFTSMAGTTGLISPTAATPLVSQVATGQGVPLPAAGGSRVRLFFEALGSDGKTRIMFLDSQDGYTGRDFNSGSATICSTAADYQIGGGCAPTVAIGVEGDATNANSRIRNARQFKLGFPILNDWRWSGAAGTYMVFTTDSIPGCSASGFNHGYAVWDGSRWNVQYETGGCPKLFKSVQAMFPMHVGDARYKGYFGDPSITTGKGSSQLPFLGPKKLVYADGRSMGSASTVDFEDWEATGNGRDVVFVWPNGDQLSATAEGYIDDFHFLAPTGNLDLQVMYMAITDGTAAPIGAAAVLLNP